MRTGSDRCRWLLFLALILMASLALAAPESNPPPIASASEYDYPPFCVVDAEGNADGFSVELLRTAAAAMGREVTFRVGLWAEVKRWLEQGEVEALPLVGRTPEREDAFDFTFPYLTLHGAIVVRRDTTGILDLEDLRGLRVVVMAEDNAEEFLRREPRDFEIHTVPTYEQAFRELSAGRYDAAVSQRLMALRLIQDTGLTNLRVIDKPLLEFNQDFTFAVAKGSSETLALLNEGLALVMADGTYRRLYGTWVATLELPTHRRIVVGGDDSYPPYEYLDDEGRPTGYNVELTRAIAQEVGLEIEIRLMPWTDAVRALESGEIDVLQGMFYTPERARRFGFTPPHLVSHNVSVVRKGDEPAPATVEELAGRRIVVQRGDIMHEYALEHGLAEQLHVVDSQELALAQLAAGRHDCALVSRLTALYWIRERGWDNLSVGRRSLLSLDYCYAVPEGREALLAQFTEGLRAVQDSGEYRRIQDKWLGVYRQEPVGLLTALRYSAMVLVPLVLALLGFLAWTWALRKQVGARTADLRRSEATLRESESRYRELFDQAPVGIFTSDSTGRFRSLNPAMARMLGFRSPEEPVAHYTDVGAELYKRPERRAEFLQQLREKGRVGDFEFEAVTADGREVWIGMNARVAAEEEDGTLVIEGFTTDITTRKEAEAERERLMAAIEQAGEVIVVTDPDGTIQYVNPAFERVTGYSRDEAVGQNPRILKSGRQNDAFYADLWRRISAGEVWKGRFENKRKDGTLYTEDATISPVRDGKGAITNYVAVKSDITRELELQHQLGQAQKMESVGRLAGGVAHDFNNMLGVILGHAEMALEILPPEDPLREDLDEIAKAGRRSADLTRQLLAFARRQAIVPRKVDLNDTVGGMLKMLGRLIGEDIDLVWSPGKDLWPVRMDPAQLDQVVANLCVNARDAIDGVGRVSIETRNVILDEDYCADHAGFSPGAFVLLAVSDDGCGMDQETLANVFEPFFTTKAVGQGSGLGLATVYGIVKQNEGFINVYSEPGNGTVFRIYLPRFEGDAGSEDTTQVPATPRGHGETVLLVEDEAAILTLGRRLLEGLGYEVLMAATPDEAVRLAEEHADEVRLVITDVVMPGMNGRDLARRLQESNPGLRVLFMSGYTADVIANRGVIDEGVRFIQKPFGRLELARKVRDALTG